MNLPSFLCTRRLVALLPAFVLPLSHAALVEVSSGNLGLTIPDDSATGLLHGMALDLPGNVDALSVRLRLDVPGGDIGWLGDLYVQLQHGSGVSVLLNRVGRTGGSPFGYSDGGTVDVVFADDAPMGDVHRYHAALAVPESASLLDALVGSWQPDGRLVDPGSVLDTSPRTALLGAFNGHAAAGDWNLFLADLSGGGRYRLESWSLTFDMDATPIPETSCATAVFAALLVAVVAVRRIATPLRRRGLPALGVAVVSAWLSAPDTRGADDLTPLSDEFRDPTTRMRWLRVFQTEGWGNDPLRTFDLGGSSPGRLRMVPHTSSWFAEWRGELTYKEVEGDFVVTTEVEVRNRAGTGAPGSLYSLAGLLVRAPRTMTRPSEWTPGGQNYVFLSLGAADAPGTYQHEVKTTVGSVSTLDISPGTPSARIQVARIGRHLILLRQPPGGPWVVHRRYSRPDFPRTLQAGLTVYTDWPNCERVGSAVHNVTVLTNGAALPGGVFTGAGPDLDARFDFVRYARPRIPADLAGADLSNPSAVPDARLLAFLGDVAHEPAAPLRLTPSPTESGIRVELGYPDGGRAESHRLTRIRVESRVELGNDAATGWSPLDVAVDPTTGSFPVAGPDTRFLRAVEDP